MTAHRLNQLEVALRLGDEALARPLMDRVAALRSTGIAPLLDRVFDAASPPGQLHRIDRLDIDLGHLPWDDFEPALLQRLEDALRRAVAQALRGQPAARTDADAAREWLVCRARLGLLPWWAGRVGDAAAARQIQALRAARGWLALLASLADAPLALRRLAQVGGMAAIAVDGDAGTAVLQAAAAELAQRLAAAGAAAPLGSPAPALAGMPAGAHALAGDTPPARTWRACLLTALARGAGGGVQAVIDTALDLLPEGDRQRLVTGAGLPARSREAAAALGRLAAAGQGSAIASRVADAAPAPASRGADAASAPAAAGTRGGGDHARPGQRTPQAIGLPPPPPPSTPDTDLGPAGSKPAAAVRDAAHDASAGHAHRAARQVLAELDWIDVPDAGLVLLWPFIERLFQHCGLLTDARGFLHDAARTRGVLLLAQLSWAEPEPAEPRLALAKLLCGLEPDAAFEPDAPPTADEAAACADLLVAVLAHAGAAVPALARLDVAAFQTLFVQRPGLLGARHGSWLLQPAQRAEDALLDRLPWGWSWVRLPWMTHPLQVQW